MHFNLNRHNRDPQQHFDNAFRNWRRDLFGGGDFVPTGLYPSRRSDDDSSEEGKKRHWLHKFVDLLRRWLRR